MLMENQDWLPEPSPMPHFRQEMIPHGHVWPSGVVLPAKEVDFYNLYTASMNVHVDNSAVWSALCNDRRLFLIGCLHEAEAARAKSNPMALFRRAVSLQHQLWDVLEQLEALFDITEDDKACDQLADEIKNFACNGGDVGVPELMQFIDAMGHRRTTGVHATAGGQA